MIKTVGKKKQISFKELRNIQLEILSNVIEFCDKKKIRYYATAGTLLGAIRHEGFIPWDDDIDICMPRPDYDIFINEYNKENPDTYFCHICENTENFYFAAAKVCHEKTILRENHNVFPNNLGINIDIFPLDGWPANYYECAKHVYSIDKLHELILFNNPNYRWHDGIWLNIRKLRKKVIYKADSIQLVKEMNTIARKCSFDDAEFVGNLMWSQYGYKNCFKKDWFSDFEKKNFETIKINVPVGYISILTQLYGDYMKLPPKEKQKIHHAYTKICWK